MNNKIYKKNRENVMKNLPEKSAVVLFAGKSIKKTADEVFPFSPNRNFLYLTGINEGDPIVYIEKTKDGIKESLFINRYDEVRAKWMGETISEDRAKEVSAIEDIKYLDTFDAFIHQRIQSDDLEKLYFDMEKMTPDADYLAGGRYAKKIREEYPHLAIGNIYNELATLRQVKTSEELENMEKAIAITHEGITEIMRNAKPGMYEYELEAEFDYVLKKRGVKDFAFKTILASGKNATVLHYSSNDSKIADDSLVLLDLGASWNNYSADISRTFPVSGKFTEEQRKFYDIVILAHERVVAAIKPGVPFMRLNEIVKETYAQELKKVGLIKEDSEVVKYYFHGVSHHLGLDTHDVGRRDNLLTEGMVLTVEPGLYIPEKSIGIRVEDDVLVTKDGSRILGEKFFRTSQEVEDFMASLKK